MWEIAESASFLEKLAFGGKVTLFGLGTVFSILFIVLKILGFIFDRPKKAEEPKAEPKAIEPIKEKVELKSDDSELVAVIAAAVAAYTGASSDSFRVVSFKRK
ncbi:MAG: OadG family protein [Firmicutes bacterium]|nr:OadG family protein [Bacillota bacterium]